MDESLFNLQYLSQEISLPMVIIIAKIRIVKSNVALDDATYVDSRYKQLLIAKPNLLVIFTDVTPEKLIN